MKKIKPLPGQESVWDYPRPPRIEAFKGSLKIVLNESVICQSNIGYRILETSHPPTYYIPMENFLPGTLVKVAGSSYCEFKGVAQYFDIRSGDQIQKKAAWYYSNPNDNYADLKNHVCVYASKMDECYVNEEKVQAQEGDFYGGWITSKIVGPFKGGEGTWGW